jgi:hypothetical protein
MAWDYDAWLQDSSAYEEFCGIRGDDDEPDYKEGLIDDFLTDGWEADPAVCSIVTRKQLPDTYRKVCDNVEAEVTLCDSSADFGVCLKGTDNFVFDEELEYDEDTGSFILEKVKELDGLYKSA